MTEDQFLGNLYQRFPVTIEKGLGAHVWDINNKEYIDCMGGYGVALVGHRNERVVNAIKSQIDKIITVHSSLYSKTREEFLETLFKISPKGLTQAHLNNSGAEAIEAAIKFARKFTGKKGMVAMNGSYHGKSMGALSLTFNPKYRKSFQPLVEKVSFSPFGNIESLRSTIDDDTAFIILEPIQGESGIHVAPDGFLQDVRKLCDENEILLIFDEIQSGLGRTGRMWASDHWNTAPDILCIAKGIAGGVPMGVTMVRPDILNCISKGEHSSTFGGNPLSCAAGTATIQALTQDNLVQNADTMGKLFRDGLEKLKEKHNIIREIRGKGLMIGIELKFEVKDILMEGIEKNLLLLYSGRNILRLLPPLVITKDDVTKSLETLDVLFTNEEKRKNG
ncbi:MAG: aspartate aminotransferase family protein [Thaumarchaeota archaeon]|jgi:acetylornithine/LysW-gamma-L-lysine aminotransferase|nr:aspartate aminotransferase family protein [Nitrososphaerota archaeon]|tara:strand:+ start:1001 stop:2176 length:1176 start_codon:yes stop_codon:yes gene_type:complete